MRDERKQQARQQPWHASLARLLTVTTLTPVDAFQDQHTNALERAARRGSSLQRLLRRPVRPVPWSGQTGRRRQIGDEAYER